jgi:hypothetical protein
MSAEEDAIIALTTAVNSPIAAAALLAIGDYRANLMTVEARATDCPEACSVDLNGVCPHGWRSAARTAYMAEKGLVEL